MRRRRPIPTLETGRLVLRPFTFSDAKDVQRLAGDARVADTTLHVPHPYEDGMAEAWIRRHPALFADGRSLTLALTLAEEGSLVGAMGLEIERRHARAEAGYWIGHPFWGRGYATEALAAVLDHAFSVLDLHRVHARHFARNPASGRVMEKVGMRREGVLRQHARKGDAYEDMVLYGVLRAEWAGRRQKGRSA